MHCPCGEILALRYMFDGESRVFVYPKFSKFKENIIANQQELSGDEVVGAICFDDFSDFMASLRALPLVTYVPDEDLLNEDTEEDT